jgi:hypothetical protein
MLFVDMITPPDQGNPSILLVQANDQAVKIDYTFWDVQSVEQDGGTFDGAGELSQGRILFPHGVGYILRSSGWLKKHGITNDNPKTDVVIETMPRHGRIERIASGEFLGELRYTPDSGFLGRDFVSFIVTIENKRIRVKMAIEVVKNIPVNDPVEGDPEDDNSENRCSGKDAEFRGQKFVIFENDGQLWFSRGTRLLKTEDIPNTALAQTTGTGVNAQITLDLDAAGHGWFIDYTPYLNEEWLPTSNPYEWQAKPGSDAEGKMDLLSVVLHEYGHVLGLEHSTDSHDFMATTLQPGVRRLPSIEELTRLSPTLADAGWLAYASTLADPSQPEPNTPSNPAPLPVSVGLAAFLASRQRRSAGTESPYRLA